VMVLHDLNLAARYADNLVVMKDGQIVATGTPSEVLTPEMLRNVFGVEAAIHIDPRTGTPLIVPWALSQPDDPGLPYASLTATAGTLASAAMPI
jgi:iron complex transport system ATP-binding protein